MNVRLTKEQKGTRIMEGKDVFKIMREVILRESKYGQEMEHSWIMSLGPDIRLIFFSICGRLLVVANLRWALHRKVLYSP